MKFGQDRRMGGWFLETLEMVQWDERPAVTMYRRVCNGLCRCLCELLNEVDEWEGAFVQYDMARLLRLIYRMDEVLSLARHRLLLLPSVEGQLEVADDVKDCALHGALRVLVGHLRRWLERRRQEVGMRDEVRRCQELAHDQRVKMEKYLNECGEQGGSAEMVLRMKAAVQAVDGIDKWYTASFQPIFSTVFAQFRAFHAYLLGVAPVAAVSFEVRVSAELRKRYAELLAERGGEIEGVLMEGLYDEEGIYGKALLRSMAEMPDRRVWAEALLQLLRVTGANRSLAFVAEEHVRGQEIDVSGSSFLEGFVLAALWHYREAEDFLDAVLRRVVAVNVLEGKMAEDAAVGGDERVVDAEVELYPALAVADKHVRAAVAKGLKPKGLLLAVRAAREANVLLAARMDVAWFNGRYGTLLSKQNWSHWVNGHGVYDETELSAMMGEYEKTKKGGGLASADGSALDGA